MSSWKIRIDGVTSASTAGRWKASEATLAAAVGDAGPGRDQRMLSAEVRGRRLTLPGLHVCSLVSARTTVIPRTPAKTCADRAALGYVAGIERAEGAAVRPGHMDVPAIARVAFTSEDRVRDVILDFSDDEFRPVYPRYTGGRAAGVHCGSQQRVTRKHLVRNSQTCHISET